MVFELLPWIIYNLLVKTLTKKSVIKLKKKSQNTNYYGSVYLWIALLKKKMVQILGVNELKTLVGWPDLFLFQPAVLLLYENRFAEVFANRQQTIMMKNVTF